ncbi:MAG: dienelactone hydrolase family protein [Propionibacterium sp.]|nr:dienelactone hydrolase family protein [Propionibacterium sp.]
MIEMTTIRVGDDLVEAYVTRPDESTGGMPLTGVLFFMDAIGLRSRIAEMAERIASWGYVVVAPNVFHRYGTAEETSPSGPLSSPEAREAFFATLTPRLRDLFSAAQRPQLLSDLRGYVDALHHVEGVSQRPIGVTGYCMGTRLGILTAGELGHGVAAVGGFHGGGLVTDDPESPHLALPRARAEFLFGHADNDRSNTPEQIATLDRALDDAGLTHHGAIYEGAPHGYSMADTASYDERAAERSFTELRDLFARALD